MKPVKDVEAAAKALADLAAYTNADTARVIFGDDAGLEQSMFIYVRCDPDKIRILSELLDRWHDEDERESETSIATSGLSEEALAQKWNQRFPIGTPVRYWKGAREGTGKTSRTRTEASVLSGHTAVVWLEGVPGCIALTHVEPLV